MLHDLGNMSKNEMTDYVSTNSLNVTAPGNVDMFPSQKEKTIQNILAAQVEQKTALEKAIGKLSVPRVDDKNEGCISCAPLVLLMFELH